MGPVRNDHGMRAASMGLVDSRPGTFIGYNQNDGAPNISTTEPKHKPSSVTNASERHVARLFDRYDSIPGWAQSTWNASDNPSDGGDSTWGSNPLWLSLLGCG